MQFVTADKAKEILSLLDKKNDSEYSNYPSVFSKKDKLDVNASIFLIEYLKGDSLVLALEGFTDKAKQTEVAKKIFESEHFKEFTYFIIMFGTSDTERNEAGELMLKGFNPSSAIKKAVKKSGKKRKWLRLFKRS